MSCSLGDQLFFPCLVMKYHIYTMLKHQWPFPLKSLLKPVWFSELGRKWKFCCRGSREWRPGVLSPFASWQSLSWNLSCWLLWHRNGESSQGLPFQLQAITKWSVRPFVRSLQSCCSCCFPFLRSSCRCSSTNVTVVDGSFCSLCVY